ncbi:MAG: hypothetical protein JST06_04645 [Bacteroidetes bacterium]|nr:hypothetical protein [Bacteroidota bacterium]MBS1628848.1 hypothetical protein [Bacteroidota bacterium]
MTAEAISVWLTDATQPYTQAQIDKALNDWPWFVPIRLMDAVSKGQLDAPEKLQHTLNLYSDHWLPTFFTLKTAEVYEWLPEEDEPEEQEQIAEPELSQHAAQSPDIIPEPLAAASEDEAPIQATEMPAPAETLAEPPIIQPLYTEDYFRFEGVPTDDSLPEPVIPDQPQTLMVMMSFSEWLNHFKNKAHKEQEEAKEKSALRSMWQREKLASALEDEPEEIPEAVFQMAVSSITREDDLVSEPLAQIYERQEKWSAAAEMYQKLALKYPSKSAYFASRSEAAKQQLK